MNTLCTALLLPTTNLSYIQKIHNTSSGRKDAAGYTVKFMFKFDFCTDAYYIGQGREGNQVNYLFDSVQFVGCFPNEKLARNHALQEGLL